METMLQIREQMDRLTPETVEQRSFDNKRNPSCSNLRDENVYPHPPRSDPARRLGDQAIAVNSLPYASNARRSPVRGDHVGSKGSNGPPGLYSVPWT